MFRRLLQLTLVGIAIMGTSAFAGKVEIIAHRGASWYAPENTVSSAKTAWKMDADGVEIDIHLSKDGKIMVNHDGTTKRTADGGVDLNISDTDSSVLRKLDVGKFKDVKFTGEKMPFIEEVIDTLPKGKTLFVEIKCGPEVIHPLKKVFDTCGKKDQMVIIGFSYDTMKEAKKVMPEIPCYWLRGTYKDEDTSKYLPHDPKLIQMAKDANIDGLDVHFAGVTQDFVDAVNAAGQKLYVWTVNDPAEGQRLVKLGVAGITSDKPNLLEEKPPAE